MLGQGSLNSPAEDTKRDQSSMARVKQGQLTRLMPGAMGASFPWWHLWRSLWPAAVMSCQGAGSEGRRGRCRSPGGRPRLPGNPELTSVPADLGAPEEALDGEGKWEGSQGSRRGRAQSGARHRGAKGWVQEGPWPSPLSKTRAGQKTLTKHCRGLLGTPRSVNCALSKSSEGREREKRYLLYQ